MFICLDCGYTFEEPRPWVEKHLLDTPPYEEQRGCPSCGGDYTGTIKCGICGEYVNGVYIETFEGQVICDNCYMTKEIGG